MKKPIIAVWFSCGGASAVAAYLTIQKYKDTHQVMVFNTPVDEEDSDNVRFKNDVEQWLGQEIIEAVNPEVGHNSTEKVWKKRAYMAGVGGAPCTMLLKKGARYAIEKQYDIAYHVLGFTVEEQDRHERFINSERTNVLPVLIEEGLTKQDCFNFLTSRGLKLPRIYEVLMNANCIGCVKSKGVWYWQRIRKHFPAVFKARAELSRKINCKLVEYKGERIFLDELPLNAKGRKPKHSPECSIWCWSDYHGEKQEAT